LASFVATKPQYRLGDYMDIAKGTPLLDYVLWKCEAFMKAEEAGNYVLSIVSNYSGNRSYFKGYTIDKAIYVEDSLVATGKDYTLMGAVELEPGLYRVEFRVAGAIPKNERARDYQYFKFLIKAPSDHRGFPASQVLLTPVGKMK